MIDLYPEIEPYESGLLDAGDGNRVYWETCGNPQGKPALVVHGGPGSGCTARMRRQFDPERYRAVLFDQRGCGRSTPHAGDPSTDLICNTTAHLVSDMERLRERLDIDRWLLAGGSWGCTLALVYAQQFPHRVSEIVLTSVTTTRRSEIDWLYRGVSRFFPEEWRQFRDALPEHERGGDLVAAYARLMEHPSESVRIRAAGAWCAWEDAVISLEPGGKPNPYSDRPIPDLIAFVRICSHYFSNAAWLVEGELIRNAYRLAGIPGVLIHGRLDLSSPFDTAWELAQSWPGAELISIEDSGHKATDSTRRCLLSALNRFTCT